MIRKTLLLLSLSMCTLVVCLMVAEIVLRLLRLYEPPPYPPTPRNPTLYRGDDVVGYRLWPSEHTSYRYPDGNPLLRTVVSNSDGFRNNHNFDDPYPGARILVTGDSFVFGDGVDSDQRVTEQLGREFPDYRVDNLGMTGWGVDLMLRATRLIAPRVKPELLLVCIYTDDFHRVDPYYSGMGYPIPRYTLKSGKLTSIPYPNLSRMQRLRLNQARVRLTFKYSGTEFRIHEALLDEFRALSKQLKSKLAFIFLPGRDDSSTDKQRRQWLADYGKRTRVPVLDLTGPIHSAGVERTYIKNNWHWNPTGHQVAAEHIARFLREQKLVRPMQPAIETH